MLQGELLHHAADCVIKIDDLLTIGIDSFEDNILTAF
jgi:hypothetical protein